MLNYLEDKVNILFDSIENRWESKLFLSISGYTLVVSFVVLLILIELLLRGFLPHFLDNIVPHNHFYAINYVFTLLLVFEVISLVFSLVHSVASSVGKQFEILSLILLRNSFKEFIYFPEPIKWDKISEPIFHILSDATGALLIFVILGFYYNLQKHQLITKNSIDQKRFVSAKKLLALVLIIVFIFLGVDNLWKLYHHTNVTNFFASFYTILIFSDILIVLISLRYCQNYYSVFRNSAFALTTVFIRLALSAPVYYNVAIAVFTGLYTLGVTYAYNSFYRDIETNEEK